MNPEQQRIAIAEACGVPIEDCPCPTCKEKPRDRRTGKEIPGYPNDLNAMHEAEKVLSPQQWTDYVTLLCAMTRDRNGEGLVFATAPQRAEAFLITLGLWKE